MVEVLALNQIVATVTLVGTLVLIAAQSLVQQVLFHHLVEPVVSPFVTLFHPMKQTFAVDMVLVHNLILAAATLDGTLIQTAV
mgnify:CR=1 FL=1